jgi:hypothetical protein
MVQAVSTTMTTPHDISLTMIEAILALIFFVGICCYYILLLAVCSVIAMSDTTHVQRQFKRVRSGEILNQGRLNDPTHKAQRNLRLKAGLPRCSAGLL